MGGGVKFPSIKRAEGNGDYFYPLAIAIFCEIPLHEKSRGDWGLVLPSHDGNSFAFLQEDEWSWERGVL